jgi:hypothetical protein
MKITISILIILVFTFCAFGQASKIPAFKYVQVSMTDDGLTSELLLMPIGMSPSLSGAEIGIKFFGVESDSDISVILVLKGTKNRYSTNETFAVKLYSDDLPVIKNKFRMIGSVRKEAESIKKETGKEILQFFITSEELAWLAMAGSVKIEIYNFDEQRKYDTLSFTPTGLTEFKGFAKSVLLIRSQ